MGETRRFRGYGAKITLLARILSYSLILEYIARSLTYAGAIIYAVRLDHPFYSIDDLLFVPISAFTYDGTVLAADSVRTALENGKMAFGLSTPRGLAIILPFSSYLVALVVVYGINQWFVSRSDE